MANGDIFRLTLEGAYTAESIAVQHVLWFRQTSSTPVAGEADQLAVDFGNNLVTGALGETLRRVQSPGFQWLFIRCQKMLDPFEPPVSYAVPTITAGQGVDESSAGGFWMIPSIACMVATLTSERGGRSGLGRIYFGGFALHSSTHTPVAGALADHGRWSIGYVAHVQTWLDNLQARYDGATVLDGGGGMQAEWGVWSRKFGNQTPPHNPAGFSPMVGHLAGNVIRLQRRRQFGIGQ